MKPKPLLTVCCIVFGCLLLIFGVDNTYAQRGRGGGGGFSRGGAASRGSFSAGGGDTSRQQTSTANQAQRQAARAQNVETRQQAATNRTNARAETINDTGGRYWDNGAAAATGFVAGAAVGAAARSATTVVTAGAVPVAALPCSAAALSTEGANYYRCGSTYYTEAYADGSVMYVETGPPPGVE
jgi:hypothetical protein